MQTSSGLWFVFKPHIIAAVVHLKLLILKLLIYLCDNYALSLLQQKEQGRCAGPWGREQLRMAGRPAAGDFSEVNSMVIKGRSETRTKLPATV